MAGYREHISVSGMLGVAYGAIAVVGFGFTPVQACLAACLTWIAGMLPDLDSETGKPVREIFSLLAAVAPMVLAQRLLEWSNGSPEMAMLLAVATYAAIRYGGSWLLGKVAVHRGMFHSIPAVIIASELTFIGFKSSDVRVKLLMALGVAFGFLSHLVLDELYSVEWTGIRLRLNKAAGSAVKFFSSNVAANAVTYALLGTLTWVTLIDLGWVKEPAADDYRTLLPHTVEAPLDTIRR